LEEVELFYFISCKAGILLDQTKLFHVTFDVFTSVTEQCRLLGCSAVWQAQLVAVNAVPSLLILVTLIM
jgi:hypothetical protein